MGDVEERTGMMQTWALSLVKSSLESSKECEHFLGQFTTFHGIHLFGR